MSLLATSLQALPPPLRNAPQVARILWRLSRGKPAIASVNVLDRCNQACPMCAVHESGSHGLPLDQLARAFRALAAGGICAVELSGGEPFLRQDLPDVIRLVEQSGLLFTFNTNGTAIHQPGLDALVRSPALLQLAMSLDSLDRDTYALLRGRDLLPLALEGLDRLRGAGLRPPLKLNVALSRHNGPEVPRLLAFAKSRGLFLSVFPVNQGPGFHRSANPIFQATPEQSEEMALTFERLAALRRQGEPLWEPSAFYLAAAKFLRREPLAPCGAGRLYLDVRSDGSVAPCVDQPAVATLDDLADGSAWSALERAQGNVHVCRATTPCCYTCTVSLAETGRHPITFAFESAQVLFGARLTRLRVKPPAAG